MGLGKCTVWPFFNIDFFMVGPHPHPPTHPPTHPTPTHPPKKEKKIASRSWKFTWRGTLDKLCLLRALLILGTWESNLLSLGNSLYKFNKLPQFFCVADVSKKGIGSGTSFLGENRSVRCPGRYDYGSLSTDCTTDQRVAQQLCKQPFQQQVGQVTCIDSNATSEHN